MARTKTVSVERGDLTTASARSFLKEKDPTSLLGKYGVRGEIVVFSGPTECYKSITSTFFAAKVSLGIDAITGEALKEGRCRTLIYSNEDPRPVIAKRLHAMGADFGRQTRPRIHFANDFHYDTDGKKIPITMGNIKALDEEWTRIHPDLVIFDVLRSFAGVSTNNNDAIERIFGDLIELARKHNCCVFILHHSVKNVKSRNDLFAGANSIQSRPRNAIVVMHDPLNPNGRVLIHVKSSFERKEPTRRFHLANDTAGGLSIAWDGETDWDIEDVIAMFKPSKERDSDNED